MNSVETCGALDASYFEVQFWALCGCKMDEAPGCYVAQLITCMICVAAYYVSEKLPGVCHGASGMTCVFCGWGAGERHLDT